MSSQCGHTRAVKQLLEAGADPALAMRDRATALFVAAQNGHTEVARLVGEGGRDEVVREEEGGGGGGGGEVVI